MARDILLLVEAESATVQLVQQLLGHLAETSDLTWRMREVHDVSSDDLGPDTFPLIIRSCNPHTFALTSAFARAGIDYGFYIDDNFWKLDRETEIGRYYAERQTRRQLEAIVRGARLVMAATEPLRDYLSAYSDHVVQLDSFYDFTLAPASLEPPPERRILRGGFAASIHRGGDLAAILPAVLSALAAHDELEFEIVGATVPGLPQDARIRCFPYEGSYEEYTRFQLSRQWDFGLAPLGAAESNVYKTDNKYREYAALGIAGIYEDAAPYARVGDRDTGLLAGTHRTWEEAIALMCADRELRLSIRNRARQDAESRVSIAAVAPQWGEVLDHAPRIGDDPDVGVRFESALAGQQRRRRVNRVKALWGVARAEYAVNGLASTVHRSARFLGNRMRR